MKEESRKNEERGRKKEKRMKKEEERRKNEERERKKEKRMKKEEEREHTSHFIVAEFADTLTRSRFKGGVAGSKKEVRKET